MSIQQHFASHHFANYVLEEHQLRKAIHEIRGMPIVGASALPFSRQWRNIYATIGLLYAQRLTRHSSGLPEAQHYLHIWKTLEQQSKGWEEQSKEEEDIPAVLLSEIRPEFGR